LYTKPGASKKQYGARALLAVAIVQSDSIAAASFKSTSILTGAPNSMSSLFCLHQPGGCDHIPGASLVPILLAKIELIVLVFCRVPVHNVAVHRQTV
jgi:hypothetical protein